MDSQDRHRQRRDEAKELGWRIVYVRHRAIGAHIAYYNVMYRGKRIAPAAAARLGIPLNQIWISERFRKDEAPILFHEMEEIRYRRSGYGERAAHRMAFRVTKSYERRDARRLKVRGGRDKAGHSDLSGP